MPSEFAPCPLVLHCRDAASFRRCLTYFSHAADGTKGLDLSNLRFIDPSALVLLHHCVQRVPHKRVYVQLPARQDVRDFFEQNLGVRKVVRARSSTSYPLRAILRAEDVPRELERWGDMLSESTALDDEECRGLSSTMSEVLANSFSHGQTRLPCILGGQTFPRHHHTVLAAIDSGRTIPVTLRERRDRALKSDRRDPFPQAVDWCDHQWIEHSLAEGVSCKTFPWNEGMGLAVLTQKVRDLKGKMLLASGDGLVWVEPGAEPRGEPIGDSYDTLNGTFVLLDFPTRSLLCTST